MGEGHGNFFGSLALESILHWYLGDREDADKSTGIRV